MCLSSGDAPAASKAPAGSKALARVLSAVPQGESKENSFTSSSDVSETNQSTDKDSSSVQPNTQANSTSTGKSCHFSICVDFNININKTSCAF